MGSEFWSQSSLPGYNELPALYQVMCESAVDLQWNASNFVLSPSQMFQQKILFASI